MFSFLTLAVAMFVVAPALAAPETNTANEATHDGKVVSITNGTLVMTNKEGQEHLQTLAADAKVSCDGKDCKASDLKAGMKIRVPPR